MNRRRTPTVPLPPPRRLAGSGRPQPCRHHQSMRLTFPHLPVQGIEPGCPVSSPTSPILRHGGRTPTNFPSPCVLPRPLRPLYRVPDAAAGEAPVRPRHHEHPQQAPHVLSRRTHPLPLPGSPAIVRSILDCKLRDGLFRPRSSPRFGLKGCLPYSKHCRYSSPAGPFPLTPMERSCAQISGHADLIPTFLCSSLLRSGCSDPAPDGP
jgi:hypothetical protein